MIDPDTLHLWYERRLVGYLWRDSANIIGFRYDEAWLDGGFPISQSLPLTDTPFEPGGGLAQRFFGNLLPEGNVRDRIIRALKIPDTDFDLLRAIGGECAGALSVLHGDRQPDTRATYRELEVDALNQLILSRGQFYRQDRDEGNVRSDACRPPRLSLAGAQDKCPVLIRGERIFLPEGDSPSSHILKFAVPDYKNVPLYEAILIDLAKGIGLNTVEAEFSIAHIPDHAHEYLVIRRYDRELQDTGSIRRLHQEDFCQALGVGRESKYEGEGRGGIRYTDCYRLLREISTEPAYDLPRLLRWQIFNYLAGNADGHAKNLSLVYSGEGQVRLAPFYDLVCTRAIEQIDTRLAFAIGGERQPGNILRTHWEQFAKALQVRPKYLLDLVAQDADQILATLASTLEAFQNRHGEFPALQRVSKVVERQCKRALVEIKGPPP